MRVLLTATLSVLTTVALAATAAADWVRVNSAAYGFAADFPEQPKEESTVDNGVKIYSLAAGDSNGLCIALRGEYPYTVDPDVELVASRDNFVKGMSATLSNSKRTTFMRGSKSLAALEFNASSATHDFRSILVVEGPYAYQIAGGVPKTDGNASDLERCVRGFMLTPGP